MGILLAENKSLLIYSVFFLAAIVFSLMINALFLRFLKTLGIRDQSDGTIIRWGTLSKPSIGGITFYILFLLSLAIYSIFIGNMEGLQQMRFIGLILSCGTGFIIGLADDAYNTRPFLKFGFQLLSGIILIVCGITINLFPLEPANQLLTLFWVVGIMNAINMLDNMDGITATVSCGIIGNTIFRIIWHGDTGNMHLMVLIGVFAALLAFLRFNWHPSKMYMGDTGSQFLGIFLAAMGIIYFWNDPYAPEMPATGKMIAITVMTFILPIIDTTVVVTNRMLAGKSPFVGGKDHTTHSLVQVFGISDGKAALVFAGLSLVALLTNVLIEMVAVNWTYGWSALFGSWFLLLLGFFYYTTRQRRPDPVNNQGA